MRHLDIPRHLRLCPLCCVAIGDEQHFLLECDNVEISQSRSEMMKALKNISDGPWDLFSILKRTESEIIIAVGKHLKCIEEILKV